MSDMFLLISYLGGVSGIKGAICNCGEEIQTLGFRIYSMNDVIVQTQKCSYLQQLNKRAGLRGKQAPRTLLEARGVAGSAKCKQSETV